jgi:hypothetical protein
VAKKHGLRLPAYSLVHQLCRRHRSKLAIDEPDLVAVIDQRPADGQKTERREVIVGNSAANGWMWNVDQEYTHNVTSWW